MVPLARVLTIALEMEEDGADAGRPATGAALSRAVAAATKAYPESREGRVWLITDHNGEHEKGLEYGGCLARLASSLPGLDTASTWFSATSFGDTGAASGAMSIVRAFEAFKRSYAPSAFALILSSEDVRKAAVLIARPV